MSERFLEVFLHPATREEVEATLAEVLESGEVTVAEAPHLQLVALSAWLPHPTLWTAIQRLSPTRTVWESGYCTFVTWSADHVSHRGQELYAEGIGAEDQVYVRFGQVERRCARDRIEPEVVELAERAARALPDVVGEGRVVLPTAFGRHLFQARAEHAARKELGPETRFVARRRPPSDAPAEGDDTARF